jgi:hypothetical protein
MSQCQRHETYRPRSGPSDNQNEIPVGKSVKERAGLSVKTKNAESQHLTVDHIPDREVKKWNFISKFFCEYKVMVRDYKKVTILVDRLYELLHIYGLKRSTAYCGECKIGLVPFDKESLLEHRRQSPMDCDNCYGEMFHKRKAKFTFQILKYVSMNGEGTWKDVMKYKACAFFSYIHNQDIPSLGGSFPVHYPLKSSKVLIGGHVDRWLRCLPNRSDMSIAWSLAHSILFLKQGSPPANDCLIRKAVYSTVKKLCTKPSEPAECCLEYVSKASVNEFNDCVSGWEQDSGLSGSKTEISTTKWCYPINLTSIKNQLRRTTIEFMQGMHFSYSDIVEPYFPSTKSNVEVPRGMGGQVSVIYDIVDKYREKYSAIIGERPLVEFCLDETFFRHRLSEVKGSNQELDQEILDNQRWLKNDEKVNLCGGIDLTRIEKCYEMLYWDVWKEAVLEIPMVEAVGLPEPFKIRPISKGPPRKYFCLKPIQDKLWTHMQNFKIFELTGKPVETSTINSLFRDIPENHEIISGDYKESTNNLHSWVSETICEVIMKELYLRFPPEELELLPGNFFRDLTEMMMTCLTGHIFHNNSGRKSDPQIEVDGEIPSTLKQQEGQLMGSIISFPFLNIANAAICRYAMEIANHETYTIKQTIFNDNSQCKMRINGDDCVFAGDELYIRHCWETIASFCGLESSIGKTYFSKTFCVINSKLFDFKNGFWVERPHVNLGLLYGQSKSGLKSCEKPTCTLGAIHRELLKTCPQDRKINEECHRSFMKIHKDKLHKIYNLEIHGFESIDHHWYMPEWLGGLGLDNRYYQYSSMDRARAFMIRKLMDTNPALSPKIIKDPEDWKIHKLVNNRYLSQINWLGPSYFKEIYNPDYRQYFELEVTHRRIYKLLTVATLFDPMVAFCDMFWLQNPDTVARNIMRAHYEVHKHNEQIFKTAGHLLAYQDKNYLIPVQDLVPDTSKFFPPLLEKANSCPSNKESLATVYRLVNIDGIETFVKNNNSI